MEYFGTFGQLSLFVTRVLTMERMGLRLGSSAPPLPVRNFWYAGEAKWLFWDCVPVYKVDIVIEHARGPALDGARILEFLISVSDRAFIFFVHSSEGKLMNSICRLLAS